MAKATLTLESGATVVIDGSPEEVHRLLQLHAGAQRPPAQSSRLKGPAAKLTPGKHGASEVLAALIQRDRQWTDIETHFLNSTSQLARTLLCFEFAERNGEPWLAAKDVEAVTDELGARLDSPNVSKAIRLQGKKCFVADRTGPVTRFKINRLGRRRFREILAGKADRG